MAKVTRVKLIVPLHEMEADFAVPEAEELLAMPNNGGWVLPEDSEFVYENGIISRRSKAKSKEGDGKCNKD